MSRENQHPSGRGLVGRLSSTASALCVPIAAAAALSAAPAYAAVTIRGGIVNASITVSFAAAPPTGSELSCSIALVSTDALSAMDNKATTVAISGTPASCSVQVPYRWRVLDTASKMKVIYSVSGPSQSSSAVFTTLPLPANGATTNISIQVRQ